MAGIDSFTKLMLHNDDVGLSDSSITPKTMSLNGDVARSAAQSVFGGFAAVFDGAGDSISTSTNISDFNFTTSDWTIDGRIWNVNENVTHTIWGDDDAGGNVQSTKLIWRGSVLSTLRLFVVFTVGGTVSIDHQNTLAVGAWGHVAAVRNGNEIALYLDGVKSSSTINATGKTVVDLGTSSFFVGRAGSYAGDYHNGYIDEFRVSNGIARWTTDFTPPTSAYSLDVTATGGYRTLMGVGNGSGGSAPVTSNDIIMETGDYLLLEDGSKILLEV